MAGIEESISWWFDGVVRGLSSGADLSGAAGGYLSAIGAPQDEDAHGLVASVAVVVRGLEQDPGELFDSLVRAIHQAVTGGPRDALLRQASTLANRYLESSAALTAHTDEQRALVLDLVAGLLAQGVCLGR